MQTHTFTYQFNNHYMQTHTCTYQFNNHSGGLQCIVQCMQIPLDWRMSAVRNGRLYHSLVIHTQFTIITLSLTDRFIYLPELRKYRTSVMGVGIFPDMQFLTSGVMCQGRWLLNGVVFFYQIQKEYLFTPMSLCFRKCLNWVIIGNIKKSSDLKNKTNRGVINGYIYI